MERKVLIIDDDPLIGTVYTYLLTSAGFRVRYARDAVEGLLALKEFVPDVALLDLDLPNISGIEWLREVRAYPKLRHLAVIIFSACAHAWQVEAAKQSDAMYVLSKQDTDPQVVVQAVREAAARQRLA